METLIMIDDDKSVLQILKLIIARHGTIKIAGTYSNPTEAMKELKYLNPDIVIIDLLMPEIDGIEFVKRARETNADTMFIMLSQVSDNTIVAQAYEAGIEFFIHKPLNSIEVIKVIENVREKLQYKRALYPSPVYSGSERTAKLKSILSDIGILSHSGSSEILTVCEYAIENEDDFSNQKLKDVCTIFSDTPKSMEQRIRRAAAQGLNNLAVIGANDDSDKYFKKYASALYGFEQIRNEINYIEGKSQTGGTVKLKEFIRSLLYLSTTI